MSGKFEQWGIVEIMGHAQLAGRISEETIAGTALLRVDVPQKIEGESEFRTEYVGGNSIYRLRVTTEEVAREIARRSSAEPTYAYGLRMQTPALADRSNGGDDGHDDDAEGRW